MKYEERPFAVQLKLDVLLRCYQYPVHYYEKKSDREIMEFYYSNLSNMAEKTIENVKGIKKENAQLSLF